jgi:hypothetical protein
MPETPGDDVPNADNPLRAFSLGSKWIAQRRFSAGKRVHYDVILEMAFFNETANEIRGSSDSTMGFARRATVHLRQ